MVAHPARRRCRTSRPVSGYVLIELVLVFFIIALLLGIVVPGASDQIRKMRLEEDVARFARTLRTTAELAVLRGRQLDVLIDVTDGYYTVYEQNEENDYYEDLEPFIKRQGLDHCYILQIDFEDSSHQYSGDLLLHATPRGWDYSVAFDLIDDRDERHRFLRCDRSTTRVILSRQPQDLLEPRSEVSMTSPL